MKSQGKKKLFCFPPPRVTLPLVLSASLRYSKEQMNDEFGDDLTDDDEDDNRQDDDLLDEEGNPQSGKLQATRDSLFLLRWGIGVIELRACLCFAFVEQKLFEASDLKHHSASTAEAISCREVEESAMRAEPMSSTQAPSVTKLLQSMRMVNHYQNRQERMY